MDCKGGLSQIGACTIDDSRHSNVISSDNWLKAESSQIYKVAQEQMDN